MIYWSTTRRERCAVFFAKKKSGKFKFIIDARRGNLRFRDPPGVDLCSAECFGRMEVEVEAPPDDCSERMPGETGAGPAAIRPALGMADLRDCFLRMIIGDELAEYFGLPGLSPSEAREVRGAAGRGEEASDEVFGVSPSDVTVGEHFSLPPMPSDGVRMEPVARPEHQRARR